MSVYFLRQVYMHKFFQRINFFLHPKNQNKQIELNPHWQSLAKGQNSVILFVEVVHFIFITLLQICSSMISLNFEMYYRSKYSIFPFHCNDQCIRFFDSVIQLMKFDLSLIFAYDAISAVSIKMQQNESQFLLFVVVKTWIL